MKDFWEWQAERDLRAYDAMQAALENLPEQIAELRGKLTELRSPGADSGGHGGGGSADSRIINLLCLIDDRERTLKETRRKAKQIQRALECLNGEEKMVLQAFFIDGQKNAADNLAGKLGIERKAVYYRRSNAIEKFASALYGPKIF